MKTAVTNLATKIGKTVTPALGKAFDAITFSLSSEALDFAPRLNIKKEDTPLPKEYQVHWGSDYGALRTNEEVIKVAPPTTPEKQYQVHWGSDFGGITTDKEVETAPPKATVPSTQVGKVEPSKPLTTEQATSFKSPGNW